MSERLTKFPDRRVWDLSGFTLNQITLDYRVTLLLAEPPRSAVTVVIENIFTLTIGLHAHQINPEEIVSVVPLLPYLHRPVISLTAFRSGDLRLLFDGGAELEVPKDEQYESWQTLGTGEVANAAMHCSPHSGAPWGTGNDAHDQNFSRGS